MPNNKILLVEATNAKYGPGFEPYQIEVSNGYLFKTPLVRRCEDGPSKTFSTALEAQQVLWRFEHGLPGNYSSARWDDLEGDWADVECFNAPATCDREDFHADC